MVEEHDDEVVELGVASEVTRGQAIFDVDISGGQQRYTAGMCDE
jgi:hypothetical protein